MMAYSTHRGVIRTNSVWIFCLLFTFRLVFVANSVVDTRTEIESVIVLNETSLQSDGEVWKKYLLEFTGYGFAKGLQIRPTIFTGERGDLCKLDDELSYLIRDVWVKNTSVVSDFDIRRRLYKQGDFPLYFCVGFNDNLSTRNGVTVTRWLHQGNNVKVDVRTSGKSKINYKDKLALRRTRSNGVAENTDRTPDSESTTFVEEATALAHTDRAMAGSMEPYDVLVNGMRIDKSPKDPFIDSDGVPNVLDSIDITIRLFGSGFSNNLEVVFTQQLGRLGGPCFLPATKACKMYKSPTDHNTATIDIRVPVAQGDTSDFYMCIRRTAPSNATREQIDQYEHTGFVHQGTDRWLMFRSHKKLLPLWASIIVVSTCLSFSALFSGLNLGLMSLDRTELKILINTGTENEQKYARQIQPVRDHGNYLLCSILLGNVLVNSIFTILLDDLTSGLIAVIFSTLMIVLFGEITPQALCSRHGLAVGAKTIYVTKAVMFVTSPLSYPISKLLDYILGEEIGNVYNRERLKELVKVTTDINDLDKDEVNIISGALELHKKTVSDVMTRIEDVFMLEIEAVLDFETVSEIMKSGFSRIPVYEGNRDNIITILFIKDLAFVDPDDNTPLKTLCQFYQNTCFFVYDDVTLDVMFNQFKEGHKGHMAFVQHVNTEGEGDPFYETVGLVTLEDVIEELIQAEIMDETDVFTDNRSKRRRNERRKQDFTIFAERRENQHIRISPQLTLATFQYLSTSVDIFKPDTISETILRRMLKQDIIYHVKKSKDKNDPSMIIYQQGKPVDYFVLILEGRVEVTIGRENLMFESGPFTYFGVQALIQNIGVAESPVAPSNLGSLQSINMETLLRHTFVPDYTVRAVTEVLYIRIKRSLYMAAKRATLMERSQKDITISTPGDQFDDEVEKLLHSLEEDGNSAGCPSPLHHEIIETYCRGNTAHGNTLVSLSRTGSPPVVPSGSTASSPNYITVHKDANSITTGKVSPGGAGDKRDEETALLSPSQQKAGSAS